MSLYDNFLEKSSKNTDYIRIFERYCAIINCIQENEKVFFDFLNYSNYLYKYNVDEILMMYAQNTDARAVATFDTWRKLDNPVQKGQRGYKIIYLNEQGYYQHFTVFDINQTINPLMPLRNWKMNSEDLALISVKLFNQPDFSKGLANYYQSIEHGYNRELVQSLSEYLLLNKISIDFKPKEYVDSFRTIKGLGHSKFVNTLNFVFTQNKRILTRIYQLQLEIERMVNNDRSRDFDVNSGREERINLARDNEVAPKHFERTETNGTSEEVFPRILSELRGGSEGTPTRADSMGIRTVLRNGRNTGLQTEGDNGEFRSQAEFKGTNDSGIHDGLSESGISSIGNIRNDYFLSDEESRRNAGMGNNLQIGNHSERDAKISGNTQQNAFLSRELSDTHDSTIDGSGISQSRISTDSGENRGDVYSNGTDSFLDGRRVGETTVLNQENMLEAEVSQSITSAFSLPTNKENISSELDGYIRLKSTELLPNLPIILNDEHYIVVSFENYGSDIGNLTLKKKTGLTTFVADVNQLEIYAKQEDLKKILNNALDTEVNKTKSDLIRLVPDQFHIGMKVIIDDREMKITEIVDFKNGVGTITASNEHNTVSKLDRLDQMEIYTTAEELTRFESKALDTKEEVSSNESSASLFKEDDIDVVNNDEWNILPDDYTFKEIEEHTFLVDKNGDYSDYPIEIRSDNGEIYYRIIEQLPETAYESFSLFDFENEEPINGSLELGESESSVNVAKRNKDEQKAIVQEERYDFQFSDNLESFYGKTPKHQNNEFKIILRQFNC